MMRTAAAEDGHGCVVLVGETGLLIAGESGTGKTRLAAALVATGLPLSDRRLPVVWVADDRVLFTRHGGRLVARPHPRIAGMAEARGLGPVPILHAPAVVVHRALRLAPRDDVPRVPAAEAHPIIIHGVALPTVSLAAAEADPPALGARWAHWPEGIGPARHV